MGIPTLVRRRLYEVVFLIIKTYIQTTIPYVQCQSMRRKPWCFFLLFTSFLQSCTHVIALISPVWRNPIFIWWGRNPGEFFHTMLKCSWLWMRAAPVFLGKAYVCFVPRRLFAIIRGPKYQHNKLSYMHVRNIICKSVSKFMKKKIIQL